MTDISWWKRKKLELSDGPPKKRERRKEKRDAMACLSVQTKMRRRAPPNAKGYALSLHHQCQPYRKGRRDRRTRAH